MELKLNQWEIVDIDNDMEIFLEWRDIIGGDYSGRRRKLPKQLAWR